jgi:hypothetical protein
MYWQCAENCEAAERSEEDSRKQGESSDWNLREIRFTDPGENSKTIFM